MSARAELAADKITYSQREAADILCITRYRWAEW